MTKIKILLATVIAYTSAVNTTNAQIVGQSNDTNYHNTTVVYVKPNTSGAQVLTSMESSTGLSDIIRIEAAPAVQQEAPVLSRNISGTNQNPVQRVGMLNNIKSDFGRYSTPTENTENNFSASPNQNPVQRVGMLDNIKSNLNYLNEDIVPAKPVYQKKEVVKYKRTVAAKPSKKMKRQSTPPASRKIFRKKPGRQKYGCPKF